MWMVDVGAYSVLSRNKNGLFFRPPLAAVCSDSSAKRKLKYLPASGLPTSKNLFAGRVVFQNQWSVVSITSFVVDDHSNSIQTECTRCFEKSFLMNYIRQNLYAGPCQPDHVNCFLSFFVHLVFHLFVNGHDSH